ncbi:NUDIX hydrolase domain-like protein [Xylariomycetidae sp. FL0641]|nr:NUDIX hydrolase domain-like protein [Xylariomycetidae sp. FL0641]
MTASIIPDLPVVADDDSMLSRRFGREVVNYFSGSPLNRVSFLRTDHAFLRAAFAHPTTSFLVFNNLIPLSKDATSLTFVGKDDVAPLTGTDPFEKSEEQMIKDFNSDISRPIILFLGLDENKQSGFEYRDYKGSPYFAVDITPKGSYEEEAKKVVEGVQSKTGAQFITGTRFLSLHAPEAAIFAQARALLDWNNRNPFCGGCGHRTMSVNAGTKRACPPTDYAGVAAGSEPYQRPACPTRQGISNLCFPRTDPTVIMAIVSADGTRLLLGRGKRYPAALFSTLAGFLEPGEGIEEAVRRETWEEAGVRVGRVVVHSSQPWPYPANLMIGAVGQALPADGETIHLGNDPELEAARWVPFDEVRQALKTGVSNLGDPAPEGYQEGALRLPPQTAIANQLLSAVVSGYLSADPKM